MKNITEILSVYGVIWQSFAQFWWIVLPVAFYFLFKFLWMDFVIIRWLRSREVVLLEIIPPKDTEKSPKIFESFYQGIAGVVVTKTPFETYLRGELTHMFSLELVGEEGKVHFYVWTERKYRNLIEAQIYAQYPDAEILEVEDYTKHFPKTIPNKDWDLWGCDVELVMPDPYPIKTYDKFEEDITGKMIDPLSAMTEAMGRLGPGQHIWLQFIIQPLTEKWREDEMKLVEELAGRVKKKSGGILQDLADVLSKVINGMFMPVEFSKEEDKEEQPVEFRLTPGEKEVLKAVEENLGKNSFKTKMRLICLGRRENFDKSVIPTFFGTLKQFNDLNLNSFKPTEASKTYAGYILKKPRLAFRQRRIYERYKNRSMLGKKIVFSSKELATLYHFPDMGVKTPTLPRIESKRGSAPPNLPVG